MQKKYLIYQGPLVCNHYCNKIQTLLNAEPTYKHQIHTLAQKAS